MVSISGFYTVFNSIEHNFIFITYEKYVKIIYNRKSVIISLDNLIKNKKLFQIYFLSFVCTEDSSNAETNIYLLGYIQYTAYIYGTMIRQYNQTYQTFDNDYKFNPMTKNYVRNPFLSQEPKRESSNKKQNKLLKNIKYDLISFEPNKIINNIFR